MKREDCSLGLRVKVDTDSEEWRERIAAKGEVVELNEKTALVRIDQPIRANVIVPYSDMEPLPWPVDSAEHAPIGG